MAYLQRNGKLLVIIGPSGAGKSSVVQRLEQQGVVAVTPSWTTRPRRPDEASNTIEHRFVSEEIFYQKQAASYFLEVVQMFGLPYWYGLPRVEKPALNVVPAVMLRVNLVPLIGTYFDDFIVYQIDDELPKVAARLKARQADGQALGSRLADYQQEVAVGRKLANRVFTNDTTLEELTERIKRALVVDF
jgi:guanylate kinase